MACDYSVVVGGGGGGGGGGGTIGVIGLRLAGINYHVYIEVGGVTTHNIVYNHSP